MHLLRRGQTQGQRGKEKESPGNGAHTHTQRCRYRCQYANTQTSTSWHWQEGHRPSITAGSVLVKAMKLSVCIPECSFCGAHLSTSRTAHAQNVWMFKLVLWRPLDVIGIPTGAGNNPQTERFGISRGLKCYSAILLRIFHRAVTLVCFQGFELQRLEFDKQNVRTGCQGVIERRLPSSFFLFFSCLTVSPGRDSALISGGKYHLCLCVSLVKHTIQEDTIYLSSAFFQMWSLAAPTRAEYRQIITVEPLQKCRSKHRKCVCMCICLRFPYVTVMICSRMDACFVSPTT